MTPALRERLAEAWAALKAGAEPGKSRFSMIYLATIGADGAPKLRTVVIRRADEATRAVGFNTDLRSPKAAEIDAEPRISVLGYDMEAGLQVRLEGMATLHRSGPAHAAAWAASAARSRVCYRHAYAPGAPLGDPAAGDPTEAMREPDDPGEGLANFGAVDVTVERIDLLDLANTGHRRAVFAWDEGWRGSWVAP
ncbi:MAG: pyridoxamine 5'-phosphate oxidase family protein [Pseudomonadota bacterium]